MHEAYLFLSLLKTIEQTIEPYKPCRIKRVVLLVGDYSGIDYDYLKRVIEDLKEGSILETAEVILQRDPIRIYCPTCKKERLCQEFKAWCPACKSFDVEIRGGLELILSSVEVERDEGEEDHH